MLLFYALIFNCNYTYFCLHIYNLKTYNIASIITTIHFAIIKSDPIDSDLELVTPLPEQKIIKQQAKRKPNRGFER